MLNQCISFQTCQWHKLQITRKDFEFFKFLSCSWFAIQIYPHQRPLQSPKPKGASWVEKKHIACVSRIRTCRWQRYTWRSWENDKIIKQLSRSKFIIARPISSAHLYARSFAFFSRSSPAWARLCHVSIWRTCSERFRSNSQSGHLLLSSRTAWGGWKKVKHPTKQKIRFRDWWPVLFTWVSIQNQNFEQSRASCRPQILLSN